MKRTEWIRVAWGITADRRWLSRPLHFLNMWLFTGRTTRLYRLARWLDGARRIRTGRLSRHDDEISGHYWRDLYSDPSAKDRMVDVRFVGACPVQGEGHVFGYPCYYRSRGEGWQFHVAATPDGDPLAPDAWVYSETPYLFPQGGWVHANVSTACIRRAVDEWVEYRSRVRAE